MYLPSMESGTTGDIFVTYDKIVRQVRTQQQMRKWPIESQLTYFFSKPDKTLLRRQATFCNINGPLFFKTNHY